MRRSQKAQMSLIIILVVAMALVFYAVSVNWTRIAVKKTEVTIAANTGAANIASQVASYGEYLLQTQMDNAIEQKDDTGSMWKLILGGILLVAGVVLCVIPGVGEIVTYFAVAMIISAVSLGVDVASSAGAEKRFSKEWGKLISNIKTTEGQFAEQGVQTMLKAIVNDFEEVSDRLDMDMDGRWYLNDTLPGDKDAPKISRFMWYNTKRLSQMFSPVPFDALQLVLADMQKNLGLVQADGARRCDYDPNTGDLLPIQTMAECDPCCQVPDKRPEICDKSTAWLEQCAKPGNADCTPSSLNACFIYDPFYEKKGGLPSGGFMSLLGEDDTNPHTKQTGSGRVAEGEDFPRNPLYSGSEGQQPGDGGVFRGSDSLGKLFPMLWLFADTGAYVKDLWTDGKEVDGKSFRCHWRAKDGLQYPACELELKPVEPATLGQVYYRPAPALAAYDQLKLPQGCSGGDCYVNVFRNTLTGDPSLVSSYDPRRIDAVRDLKLVMPPVAGDQCPAAQPGGYWKKGSDRLSQTFFERWSTTTEQTVQDEFGNETTETYTEEGIYVRPIKEMNGTEVTAAGCVLAEDGCECATVPVAERWRNDYMDLAVKVFSDFTDTAILLRGIDPSQYKSMLNTAEAWGDPLEIQTRMIDEADARLAAQIQDMDSWLAGNTADYNYTGADLWCLPPQNDPTLTDKERNAILAGGAWGSLGSVVACLDHNKSNASVFDNCYNRCAQDANACKNLPRSLVPGFDANKDASRNAVYEVVFGGSYNQDCLDKLKADSMECTFDQEGYDAALAKCTADACKVMYDKCEGALCSKMTADCNGVQACIDAVAVACKGSPACTIPFNACNANTCVLPDCSDDTCRAEVVAKKNDFNDCVYDEDAYEAGKAGCWVEDKETYDYCTTQKTTNMVNVDGTPVSRDGPRDSDFMVQIKQSRDLAVNQGEKLVKRAAYLSDLMSRVMQVNAGFKTAHQYLSETMKDSAVVNATAFAGTGKPTETIRNIIKWFKEHKGDKAPDGLGNDVIYGWFSKPSKGSTRSYGPLHLVRVQSSSPAYRKELTEKAFPVLAGGPERIPTIDTDTNWTGTKRTYTLNDRDGYVGARVIRYDEDQGSAVQFLSGLPLWKMVFRNPAQPEPGSGLVPAVHEQCKKHYMRTATGYTTDPDSDEVAPEAFIFDLPEGGGFPLSACKETVLSLLKRGIVSESCAQYLTFCRQGGDRVHPKGRDCHYDLQFSPCKK